MLAAWARAGPPEAVLAWVARMTESGLKLDCVACNTALKAHAATGKLQDAVTLLTDMMRGEGLPAPDAVSFNTVIAALAHVSPRTAPRLARGSHDESAAR